MEVMKLCQGCHNLNRSTKQPVVMSPAVQFCPLPLMKRLPVRETNHYYHNYIDRLYDGPSPEPDVIAAKLFLFLALTIQMGHGVRDNLRSCWSTMDQLYTHFYSTKMKRNRYPHILSYLHFTDNRNEPERTDKNSDRLWKIPIWNSK